MVKKKTWYVDDEFTTYKKVMYIAPDGKVLVTTTNIWTMDIVQWSKNW